MTNFLDVSS